GIKYGICCSKILKYYKYRKQLLSIEKINTDMKQIMFDISKCLLLSLMLWKLTRIISIYC
ncbi:MAG: hypothetical protein LBG48_04240, partial [Rickettsiales bacterium]|nr:hypothetical protein [Rickettsiales bacterium]